MAKPNPSTTQNDRECNLALTSAFSVIKHRYTQSSGTAGNRVGPVDEMPDQTPITILLVI